MLLTSGLDIKWAEKTVWYRPYKKGSQWWVEVMLPLDDPRERHHRIARRRDAEPFMDGFLAASV